MPIEKIKQQIFGEVPNPPVRNVDAPLAAFGGVQISGLKGSMDGFTDIADRMFALAEEGRDMQLAELKSKFSGELQKRLDTEVFSVTGAAANQSIEKTEQIFRDLENTYGVNAQGLGRQAFAQYEAFRENYRQAEMQRVFQHQRSEVTKARIAGNETAIKNSLTLYATSGDEACLSDVLMCATDSWKAQGRSLDGEDGKYLRQAQSQLIDKACALRVDTLIDSQDVYGASLYVNGCKGKVTEGTYQVLEQAVYKAGENLRINYGGLALYSDIAAKLGGLPGSQGGRYWTEESESMMYEYLNILDDEALKDPSGRTAGAVRVLRSKLDALRASGKANYEADCKALESKYFDPKRGAYNYTGLENEFNLLDPNSPLRPYVGKILAYHDKVKAEQMDEANKRYKNTTKAEREKLMWSIVQQFETGKEIIIKDNKGNGMTADLSTKFGRYMALNYFGITQEYDTDLYAKIDSYFDGDRGCGESVACQIAADVLNELNNIKEGKARRFSPSIMRAVDSRLVDEIKKISGLFAGSDFDKKEGYSKLYDATREYLMNNSRTHIDAVFGVFNTHPKLYEYLYEQIDDRDGLTYVKDDAIENMDKFYNDFLLSPEQARSIARVFAGYIGQIDESNDSAKSVMSETPDRPSILKILEFLRSDLESVTEEGVSYLQSKEGLDKKTKAEAEKERIRAEQERKLSNVITRSVKSY